MKTRHLSFLPLFVFLFLIWQPPPCFADPCPACHGTGRCPSCGGSGIGGYVMVNGIRAASGCTACGGRAAGRNPFTPGSQGDGKCRTCGGTGQVPGQQSSTYIQPTPFEDDADRQRELEAQRQQMLEEQRRKQAEEDARRKAEFERNKQEALSSMKGIADNGPGLKGVPAITVRMGNRIAP